MPSADDAKNLQAQGQNSQLDVYSDNISLNFLARNGPYHARTANRAILGGRMMSLAIVFLGWIAISLLLSPVIGRFMSLQDDSEGHAVPRHLPSRFPASARLRYGANTAMRRNVAIQQSRRDWPRMG